MSNNGKYFITGASDELLKVWSSKANVPVFQVCVDSITNHFKSFIGHSGEINKVVFTKSDGQVISVGADGIIVWKFLGDVTRDVSLLIDNYLEKKTIERDHNEKKRSGNNL